LFPSDRKIAAVPRV